MAGYGWLAWAAGAVVVASQLLVVVLASGRWRTAGVAGLIFVTLAVIAFAAFDADG